MPAVDDVVSYGYGPTSYLRPKSTSPRINHPIISPYASPRLAPADDSRRLPVNSDPDHVSASTYDRYMDEFIAHSLRSSASSSALDGPLTAKPSFVITPSEQGQIPDQSSKSRSKSRTRRLADFPVAGTTLTTHRHHRSSSGSKQRPPPPRPDSPSSSNPAFYVRTFRSKSPDYHKDYDMIDKIMNENANANHHQHQHQHQHLQHQQQPNTLAAAAAVPPAPPPDYPTVVFLDSGPNGPSHGVFASKTNAINDSPLWSLDDEQFEPFSESFTPTMSMPSVIPRSSRKKTKNNASNNNNNLNWKSFFNSTLNLFNNRSDSYSKQTTILPNGQVLKSSLKQPANSALRSPEITFAAIGEYFLELINNITIPLLFIIDSINSLSDTEYAYLRPPAICFAFIFIGWFGYYVTSLLIAIIGVIKAICLPVVLLVGLVFGSYSR